MAEYDLIVLNGLVVTDCSTGELDIAVKDGKIVKVVPRGSWRRSRQKRQLTQKVEWLW